MQLFMPIGQAVAFLFCFKMVAIRHLGFVIRVFEPRTKSFVGVCQCAKCGMLRCSSVVSTIGYYIGIRHRHMQVLNVRIKLEMRIHKPPVGRLSSFSPCKIWKGTPKTIDLLV